MPLSFRSSQYSQTFTSLAAPKANPIFHAANKNLFLKTPFDLRHLTSSSSSSFYFLTTICEGPYKLSEETTQRKHTYVTLSLSQLTNQLLQLKSSYTKLMLNTFKNCLNYSFTNNIHILYIFLKIFVLKKCMNRIWL